MIVFGRLPVDRIFRVNFKERYLIQMAKEDLTDLIKFLKPFAQEIQETALWLRDFVWTLYPHANELIYDNYNALAFGWSPTDKVGHTFCRDRKSVV